MTGESDGLYIEARRALLDGLGDRSRLPSGVLERERERLDILPPEVSDGPWPVVRSRNASSCDRLRIGHDRRGRLVLGPQVAGERSEVGGNVRLGCRIGPSVNQWRSSSVVEQGTHKPAGLTAVLSRVGPTHESGES